MAALVLVKVGLHGAAPGLANIPLNGMANPSDFPTDETLPTTFTTVSRQENRKCLPHRKTNTKRRTQGCDQSLFGSCFGSFFSKSHHQLTLVSCRREEPGEGRWLGTPLWRLALMRQSGE